MELKEIILQLAELNGPSGFEQPVAAAAAELLRPFADEIHTDVMGNLVAVRKSSSPSAPTVMLDAHIDEVGLIVTGYENGFLRFSSLGGVDKRMLPAMEVKVLTNPPVYGVIDVLPPHVLSAADREKPVAADKLFIDVGLSEADAPKVIPLGTPVSYDSPCHALGDNRICGKSLDDRSCAAILIKLMEELKSEKLPVNVVIHLAVQEEVGCRGAKVGAYTVNPDIAVVLDVTFGNTPDVPSYRTCKMNGGGAIGIGPNMTRSISDSLRKISEENSIPYQLEVMSGDTGTDAWNIQVSRSGVATGVVSLPLKYMHTPVEVIDMRDTESIVKMLRIWLTDEEGAAAHA